MKTKPALRAKLESFRENKLIVIKEPKYVTYLIKYPYKREYSFNALYWFCCTMLIPNTNLIGNITRYDADGTVEPMQKSVMCSMTAMPKDSFAVKLSRLITDGIILEVKIGRRISLYMNPYFAVAGTTLPTMLFDFVEMEEGRVLGQKLFPADNDLMKDNRNQNQRYGDFTKRVKTKYFSTYLGGKD